MTEQDPFSFQWQDAFNALAAAIVAFSSWFVAMLHSDMRRLERVLPETYARRDDMAIKHSEILHSINRLHERLDEHK